MVNVGDVIAGKYRVERVLGRGGMGMVVAATHLDLGELRAVKLMLPGVLENREAVERFLLEARAAARLKSAHTVTIHDVGTLESGEPYMVMPHLEGRDLRAERAARGALPACEAVGYVLQACEALAEAHGRGVVHRDLKPANLFLSKGPKGEPWLTVLDFGIAKVTHDTSAPGAPLTSTNAMMGTPQYMSPEQFRSTRDAGPRSDIWALGIILYEVVTGAAPFRGESVFEIFDQVRERQPLQPSQVRAGVPEGLSAAIMQCLEKDPAKRFQSVEDLAAALEPFAGKAASLAARDDYDAPTLERGRLQTETSRAKPPNTYIEPTEPPPPQERTVPAETQVLPTLRRSQAGTAMAPAPASPAIMAPTAPARASQRTAIGAAAAVLGLILVVGLFFVLHGAPEPGPDRALVGPTAPVASASSTLSAPANTVAETSSPEVTSTASTSAPAPVLSSARASKDSALPRLSSAVPSSSPSTRFPPSSPTPSTASPAPSTTTTKTRTSRYE